MSTTDSFLAALRMRESSGNYQVVNTLGFLGAYQFGEGALIDLGYVRNDGNYRDNNFSGGWTGKLGLHSTGDFLNNPAAQDQIAGEWLGLLWRYMESYNVARYAWTTVGTTYLTPAGMLAASHLLGVDALAKWISSGGTADLRDPYGTPLTEYITSFQPYDVPFGPSNPGTMASSVYGTEGADTLMGGMGHDWIFGLGGDDELVLTAGNDTLDGGSGSDWVAVRGSTAVKMDLTLGKQDTGLGHHTFISIENLRGGSGADMLRGDNAANELRGEGGNDTLDGRGGADRIIGGAGRDVMSGGLDNATDVFVFTKVSDSGIGRAADIIRDFQRGIDLIDLSGIDANRSLSGDQHFSFASGARAYSVWAVQSKGTLIIWGDTTGDHKADFEIRLTGVNGLSANDLIL